MYNLLTLVVATLLATLPSTLAGVATKSCPCYTATVTTTPEICPLCIPANCLVLPTIITTIPGPNPTCTETPTHTVSTGCVCGGDTCPTAWETVTGKFTCKRGGTKETQMGGGPVGESSAAVTTTTSGSAVLETGVMSILPIALNEPAATV